MAFTFKDKFSRVHQQMLMQEDSMYPVGNSRPSSPKALSAMMNYSAPSSSSSLVHQQNMDNGCVSPMQLQLDYPQQQQLQQQTMSPRDTLLKWPEEMYNNKPASLFNDGPSLFAQEDNGLFITDGYTGPQYIDPSERDDQVGWRMEEPEASLEDDEGYDEMVYSSDEEDFDVEDDDDDLYDMPPELEEDVEPSYQAAPPPLIFERSRQQQQQQQQLHHQQQHLQQLQQLQTQQLQQHQPQIQIHREPSPEPMVLDESGDENDNDQDQDDSEDYREPQFASRKNMVDSSTSAKSKSRSKKSNASTSTSNGPHRCDLKTPNGEKCGKVFSRPYDLVRHQDTIHAAVRKTFKCEICGDASKTFSRMDALSRHVRVKHPNGH